MGDQPKPLKVFIACAPQENEQLAQLEIHLAVLQRQRLIEIWHNQKIPAGDERQDRAEAELEAADIVLLLASPSFLASDHLDGHVAARALERRERSRVHVIPVIVRPCDWENARFGELQPLPRNERPITRWDDPNEAWVEVLKWIRAVALDGAPGARDAGLEGADSASWRRDLTELAHASRSLLSLPQTLSTGEWLDRPELPVLLDALYEDQAKPVVLLGKPGTGKSSLLARLAGDLGQRGVALLAIRCDLLPKEIDSSEKLQQWLGLSAPPARALRAIAAHQRAVLVIDQLDALCDLVDAHTQRLTVLLRLVNEVLGVSGISVALSCRDFEFRHDRRFQALGAAEMRLELLSIQDVKRVLRASGVEPRDLRPVLVEALRAPQQLKIFLALRARTGEERLLETYQEMLGALWNERVLGADGGPERGHLLKEIAQYMAEHEELTAPLARFDHRRDQVQQLEAAGILRREEGLRIAFSHQTWFTFTRARTFILGEERLCDYVRQRDGSLFTRATVWNALLTLRDASAALYSRELRALWDMPDLRLHLRALVLELLGQFDEPRDEEAAILLPVLKDKDFLRRIALGAVAGSHGWFRRLADRYLPVLMAGPRGSEAWSVLAKAWPFERDRVLALLERYWVNEPARSELTLGILSDLKQWDERAVRAVLVIVAREGCAGGIPRIRAGILVKNIAEREPALALRVVRAVLDQDLRRCREALRDRPPGNSHDHPYVTLLEGPRNLHDLVELAEQAPGPFLEAIWPWFIEVLGELADPEDPSRCAYTGDGVIRRQARGRYDPVDELPEALYRALRVLARREADQFFLLVDQWSSSDLAAVHRLLAAGLKEVAAQRAPQVVEYLLGDPRRLVVGDSSDHLYATCELLEALAPHLVLDDAQKLDRAISRSFHHYEHVSSDEVQWRFRFQRYNRLHRLRLMRALEKSAHLSAQARSQIEQETRALNELDTRPSVSEPRIIQSPMRAFQMSKASDEEILGFFKDLPDSTDWHHPSRLLQGGSIEASRELAEVAKAEPARARRLILRFHPETHQRPVAYVVEALSEAESNQPMRAVEELILDLEARGFFTDVYRQPVIRALATLAQRGSGLSDSSCEMLKRWLRESSDEPDSQPETGVNRPSSILWGARVGGDDPGGNFPILRALFLGYMRRTPPAVEPLLDVLESHLARSEKSRVWRAMFPYLKGFHRDERFHSIVARLFAEHSRARDCPEGAQLIHSLSSSASADLLHMWLHGIRDGALPDGGQAYGELLLLLAVLRPEIAWVREELEAVLEPSAALDPKLDQTRVGLAFTAVRLWSEQEYRAYATDTLLRLLPLARGKLSAALMGVFSRSDTLPADEHTPRVLDGFLEHPHVLIDGDAYALVSRLNELCPEEPERVSQLCWALLDEAERGGGALHRLLEASHALIDTACTLQRLHGHRDEGLRMFERLMQMELFGVQDLLRDLNVAPDLHAITKAR